MKVPAHIIGLGFLLISCASEKKENNLSSEVIKNYTNIVKKCYSDCYDSAKEMQSAINVFTNTPNEKTLEAAKNSWLTARDSYGLTEVFRGSNGPIDSEGGPADLNLEGQINPWPLDEAYIDYVTELNDYAGTYDSSIISGNKEISKKLLVNSNQIGINEDIAEKAVSTGWHAIEFLLWGQDNTNPKEKKAGQRPFTDYTSHKNAERRKVYLNLVTDILVNDLKKLADTWSNEGEYYQIFKNLPEKDALNNIFNGPFFLASFELSNERMLGPAVSSSGIDMSGQEDEHSCFSDNTHRDIYNNAKGIVNVLRGKYGEITGSSPLDLIASVNEDQAKKLDKEITAMYTAIEKIDIAAKNGIPFDLQILNEGEENPGNVLAGAMQLKKLGNVIKESTSFLKIITVNGEE